MASQLFSLPPEMIKMGAIVVYSYVGIMLP